MYTPLKASYNIETSEKQETGGAYGWPPSLNTVEPSIMATLGTW